MISIINAIKDDENEVYNGFLTSVSIHNNLLLSKCTTDFLLYILNGTNTVLKDKIRSQKILEKMLEPVGFGRFSDPKTGKVVAKMKDFKLTPLEL